MSKFVIFVSAFRRPGAQNVAHLAVDGGRTACGRSGWETEHDAHDGGPDCLACRRRWLLLCEEEKIFS